MPVDLHVHTTASDGSVTPEEVVKQALHLGLEAVAITDHDTIEGIEPALNAARPAGLEVIPGVELSTVYQDRQVHILGYFVDLHELDFLAQLTFLRSTRLERISRMVQKLKEMGFAITMGQVLAISGSGSVGRPHVARALIELGSVRTIADAFEKYIGKGCPAYVPRFKYAPAMAVRMIRAAGGVPVLAHPGISNCYDLLPGLVAEGLLGLEAYYPGHTWELTAFYCRQARDMGLFVTGGSDYHGPSHKDGGQLGAVTVPYKVVEEMKKCGKRGVPGGRNEKGRAD